MLLEMLKRISTQGSTEEPEACTSAITTEKVFFRFLMIQTVWTRIIFSFIGNDPQVISDDESSEFSMPKVFEGETKYFTLVSENLVKFVKMGSTQKADLTKDLDEIKVLKTVKITYDTYKFKNMEQFIC